MNLRKKLYYIIPSAYRKKIFFLFVLLIAGVIFEAFGIGILLPFFSIILNPDFLFENKSLELIFKQIGVSEKLDIIKFSLAFLFIIYLLKSLFLLLSSYLQNKISSNLTSSISMKLYDKILSNDYLDHVSKNSSERIKLFQIEINNFHSFFLSTIFLITEISIVFAVFSTLLFLEPFGTLSIMLFFLLFGTIYFFISKRLATRWGIIRELNDNNLSKLLMETFGGIKQLIISNSYNFFRHKHLKLNKIKADISAKNSTLSQVPRYYLELVTVMAFIGFIYSFIIKEKPIENLLVTLGVLVAATLRILPSVNRILTSLQQIKFYKSSLEVIYDELQTESNIYNNFFPTTKDQILFKNNFSIENLNFSYKHSDDLVLENVNLNISKGSTIGIVGLTGSGKSSLVNLIAGLVYPDNGQLKIDGKILNPEKLYYWRNNIGYVSQQTYLTDASIIENIAYGIDFDSININQVEKAVQDAQIQDLINSLPNGLQTIVGERGIQFSGGEQQRIGIARALYSDPELLIFDEATSSLDELTEEKVIKSIGDLKINKTIIIVTHRLSTLKICDLIYQLKNRKLSIATNSTISYG